MSHYPFPILFYAFACILFFSGIILYLILPTSTKHHEPLSIKYWIKMFGLFQKRQLVVSYVITFTQFLSFVAIYSSLHHLLTQTHRMTNHEILLFQCLGLIAMCISPFITSFISKVGAPKMITLGLTITCIGTLLFITGTSIYLLSITNILFVGGISLVLPAVIFHIGHNCGESKGVAMALYTFTLFLGSSLGPYMGTRMNFEYVSLTIFIILSITLLTSRYLEQKYL
jgi:predicted MFS family arabinose efflux permease